MGNSNTAGVVIVAAGESQRMGGVDKILVSLGGKPALAWVIDAFEGCGAVGQIVVVANDENLAQIRRLIFEQGWRKKIDICPGGERRQDSVKAGLKRLDDCDWVIVHDGARPLVTVDLVERGLEAARETGAAVAAVRVTDTIKVVGADRVVQYTPSRDDLWVIQTPQIFRFAIITEAYRRAKGEVTDDATLVERSGYEVKLYMGADDNIKITAPIDLALAEVLLQERGR